LGCAEGLCRLMLRNNDSKAALKRVTLCEYRQTIRKRGRRGQEEAGGGRDVDVVAVPTVSAFDVGVIGGGGGGRPHGGPRPRPHRPAPGPVGPGWLHQLSECSPAPPPRIPFFARPPRGAGAVGATQPTQPTASWRRWEWRSTSPPSGPPPPGPQLRPPLGARAPQSCPQDSRRRSNRQQDRGEIRTKCQTQKERCGFLQFV